MNYTRIKAIILDWAGTAVDYGSRAPVAALLETFRSAGIQLTVDEARRDMGLLKKDHIRAILSTPRVQAAWRALHGSEPGEPDVERLFSEFLPVQSSVLEEYGDVIPGVVAAVENWRRAGLRIGSTTGYTRELLDIARQKPTQQGYQPDASITPDMVGAGRPLPYMIYRNAIELKVWPLWACVKIGDTPVDVEEGLNAGLWTIGITRTGNEIGLSEAEWQALSPGEQQARLAQAEAVLCGAGAHFTAGSVAECATILEEIELRLAAGQRPWEVRR